MEVGNLAPVMASTVIIQPIRDDFGDDISNLAWGADGGWPNPPLWTHPPSFSPFEKRREAETDLGLGSTRSDTSRG